MATRRGDVRDARVAAPRSNPPPTPQTGLYRISHRRTKQDQAGAPRVRRRAHAPAAARWGKVVWRVGVGRMKSGGARAGLAGGEEPGACGRQTTHTMRRTVQERRIVQPLSSLSSLSVEKGTSAQPYRTSMTPPNDAVKHFSHSHSKQPPPMSHQHPRP